MSFEQIHIECRQKVSILIESHNLLIGLLQRLSRFEEEEKNRIETRKRKFFADLLNAARELQLQGQAAQKRRKQRNDGVQASLFPFIVFLD